MKKLFDELSNDVSKRTTNKYSTSFSLGILALKPEIRKPIYAIYGFVRLADEIVDSFHDYDKEKLLSELKIDTYNAIKSGISLNPILQSFQESVHQYEIGFPFIDQFLNSMEMDLKPVDYNAALYDKYIYGSAEIVGLMCLKVFTQGDKNRYEELKPYAQKLGSAFQKVNFLRDMKDDYRVLGRAYFPNVEMEVFNNKCKDQIEKEIEMEFNQALIGIKRLPNCARFGVYLAYRYYWSLFLKIKNTPATTMMNERVRVPNRKKLVLTIRTYLRYKTTFYKAH